MSGRGHGPGVALFSLSPRLRGSGALCQTKVRSYVRPRPHAHAYDQPFATLFAELFPFATQNARSIAQAVRLRRLTYVCDVPLGKRFAARPFGSQLGKCFGNRFARLFASIVCLELIGYCLWLWLNQSGVFAVCLTPSNSLPYILPTFFAVCALSAASASNLAVSRGPPPWFVMSRL